MRSGKRLEDLLQAFEEHKRARMNTAQLGFEDGKHEQIAGGPRGGETCACSKEKKRKCDRGRNVAND